MKCWWEFHLSMIFYKWEIFHINTPPLKYNLYLFIKFNVRLSEYVEFVLIVIVLRTFELIIFHLGLSSFCSRDEIIARTSIFLLKVYWVIYQNTHFIAIGVLYHFSLCIDIRWALCLCLFYSTLHILYCSYTSLTQ